jgi:hypothetical protein
MASHILIDGYNLIRQSGPLIDFEAISLEEGRNGLIRLLAAYRKVKGHTITVVFDGWESDNIGSSREKMIGIDIIYSGRGVKADDLIKKMVDERRDKVIVVTSDREIETHALKRGAVVIPSAEFEMKVRMATAGTEDDYFMEEEDDEGRAGTKKKGPARRLSRVERKKQSKMKKL